MKSGVLSVKLITHITEYVLQNPLTKRFMAFSSEKYDRLIAYTMAIYYYIYYLPGRSKILKTENWKQKTEILWLLK